MNEKRFIGSSGGVYDQYKSDRFAWSEWEEIIQIMNNLNEKAIERSKALSKLQKENEQLKQQLSDINGQLVMLDKCDNWDYDRMKHTVREIAEIIGYNGTINPKR